MLVQIRSLAPVRKDVGMFTSGVGSATTVTIIVAVSKKPKRKYKVTDILFRQNEPARGRGRKRATAAKLAQLRIKKIMDERDEELKQDYERHIG